MPRGAVEDDDPVAASAAHHAGGVLLAGAFDKNLCLLANEILVARCGDFIDQLKQALVALLFDGLRKLAGHRGGWSVAPRGAFEDEGLIKLHFARERHVLL